MIAGEQRVCAATGFTLSPAAGGVAWRVTQERFVRASGINGVLVNTVVGPLPAGAKDSRGRYDTVGRTVYFAANRKTAFAEVLQAFRNELASTLKDADAIGVNSDDYVQRVLDEAHARGSAGPGEVPVEWQMDRGLFGIHMPGEGWWVQIDSPGTMNALTDAFPELGKQLTLGDVCSENRALTTGLAQYVRDSTLDDGSLPLGIEFPSKTGYGRCWAWWNRRADDNMNPSTNDPQQCEDLNVNVAEFHQVCKDWHLKPVGLF